MLKTIDNINRTRTLKPTVLMLLIFIACLLSASGQSFSNYEIIELININVLQIDILAIQHSHSDKLNNWILLEGKTNLVLQGRNINYALIKQVRGIDNITKALQQGHNNHVGYKYADKKECIVYQSGSRNYTEIKQFGNQNKSQTFNTGNRNEVDIIQHGKKVFLIDCFRGTKKTVILQTGFGNSATITQAFYP